MNVELIYDQDCPNVEATREAILRAFTQIERPPNWTEWERTAPETPSYARSYGSPTVLINGNDVAPADCGPDGNTCRLYTNASGELLPVPPVDTIIDALASETGSARGGFGGLMAALPTGGAFLLPIGACPACWPAYTALLGSLGLGFLLSERYLFPLAALFLVVTLATLAYRAPARRGYRPFVLGLAGAASALIGKFAISSDPILYIGLGIIFAAAVWNAWPQRQTGSCPRCTSPLLEPDKDQT